MEQQEQSDPVKKIEVLILDDDPVFSMIFNASFNRVDARYNCKTIENVDGAIEYIKLCIGTGTGIPNLLFVDMNMPDKDGIQFIEEYENIIGVDCNLSSLYLLSSGMSPNDELRALSFSSVTGIESKSDILEFIERINQEHFVTKKGDKSQ